ncbi:YlmH/Sll1252 family protein [Desulfosporosinus acidiphilus]|nr:YlmH/Sll1252 family protein [Desulfosporosinus acidiphilus]
MLKFWSEKEAYLSAAHLLDQMDAVLHRNSMQVTTFLSFAMREWAEGILNKEQLAYLLEGGFPDAERVRIVIGSREETLDSADANLSILEVLPANPHTQLEHRQILGSLIGLGIGREVLGDIRAGLSGYYLAASTEIAPFLLDQWKAAGREKIKVSLCHEKPNILSDVGEQKRVTVSSTRLDALLAHSFGVSRASAQEWIKQGRVRREGLVVSKAELKLQPGETISCRGQGRIRLLECTQTRKERTAWQLVLYKSQRQ